MNEPREPEADRVITIEAAMDMPERARKCAYLGGYVDDGETICHFGEEYMCRAPRLVPTGNGC